MKIGDVVETMPERNLCKIIIGFKHSHSIYGDVQYPILKTIPIISRKEEKEMDARLDKLIEKQLVAWENYIVKETNIE